MRRLTVLIALIAALALPAQALGQGVAPNAAGANQYVPPTPPTVAVAMCMLPNGRIVPVSSVAGSSAGSSGSGSSGSSASSSSAGSSGSSGGSSGSGSSGSSAGSSGSASSGSVPPCFPTKAALPFTGEDVLLIVLAGLLLVGGGLTLYRQVRER